jgi:hypothetical protein
MYLVSRLQVEISMKMDTFGVSICCSTPLSGMQEQYAGWGAGIFDKSEAPIAHAQATQSHKYLLINVIYVSRRLKQFPCEPLEHRHWPSVAQG